MERDDQPAHSPSQNNYAIFKYWKWELLGLLLATGLVAAMFALLLSFDGLQVPNWGYSINLSTLLSLLATIFRAVVVTLVGQVIAQAKWAWYSQSRPLQHLQSFDNGVRGALGSALLLPRVFMGSFVATVAALVMIVSLATNPFVQQAIKTTSCTLPVVGVNATLPYAHFVPRKPLAKWPDHTWDFDALVNLELKKNLYESLTGESAIGNQINPDCLSGNCTFPSGDPAKNATMGSSYSTIGLCSTCIDASSLINVTHESDIWTFLLPNGIQVQSYYGTVLSLNGSDDLLWSRDLWTSELTAVARWTLANITILTISAQCGDRVTPRCPITTPVPININALPADSGSNLNRTSGAIAASCAIYACARRYAPSVTNNQLSEIQIDTTVAWPASADGPRSPENYSHEERLNNPDLTYAAIQLPCKANGMVYTSQNLTSAPNTTTLWMYETLANKTAHSFNVSAPEPCIYRHGTLFASHIAEVLQQYLFPKDSECTTRLMVGVSCGSLDLIGEGLALQTLWNNGNATVPSIVAFFDSFTIAMTNRYRTSLGGAAPVHLGDTTQGTLGEAQGIVWQDSVCTTAQWQWLLLPAALLVVTSLLVFWSVARSWRLRHIEPVWKDAVLPAILYKDRFIGEDGSTISLMAEGASSDNLMEINDMERSAQNLRVKFRLPASHSLESTSTETMGSITTGSGWASQYMGKERKTRDSDLDSLLMSD